MSLKLYGVLLVLGVVVPVGVVVMAFRWGQGMVEELRLRDKVVMGEMQERDEAWIRLQEAEEYVAYGASLGLDIGSVEEKFVMVKDDFVEGRYGEVDTEEVLTEVAVKQMRNEKLLKKTTEALEQLNFEVVKAKEQGVVVKEIEGKVEEAKKKLAEKKYEEITNILSEQRGILDKLVAEKKKSDEEEAKKKKVVTVQLASVAAQSNGGIGYERKTVNTPKGVFTTDVLRVDLSRSWARTFVAQDGDCSNDCATKPLASYVSENGGVAGINGTYFCPPDYAHCAQKKNSFDLLVFDYRTKRYANSGNNQYSTNPLMNFYPGRANLYGQALGFGRDGGANGVISNFPLLLNNGTIVGGDTGKGTRGAIGFNGGVVWAVIVRNASFQDTAFVLQALGANNGLNLDGGGSSALYMGGYRVGPGRSLPNAVVFGN